MSSFIADSNNYNVTTEQEITAILSNFNPEYIMQVVEDIIKDMYSYNYISNTVNIISSYETYFKQLKSVFSSPDDIIRIEETRISTYCEILDMLGRHFNLEIDHSQVTDYYALTYYCYDLLICKYISNIVKVMTTLTIKEKNTIFNTINLNDQKRNKDITTVYNKKVFKNPKLAVIASNIDVVLDLLFGYDIQFEHIYSIVYGYDETIINMFKSCVYSKGDFYKNHYVGAFNIININATLITMIRMEIQSHSVDDSIGIKSLLDL